MLNASGEYVGVPGGAWGCLGVVRVLSGASLVIWDRIWDSLKIR